MCGSRAGTAFRRALAALACLAFAAALAADERILEYDAQLRIATDGAVNVTETIVVRAEGKAIRRGIYREFPTEYRDRYGNRVRVGFEVLGVTRDDAPEAWHAKRRANGVRVYAGRADRTVAPGVHRYVIHYRTTRQLGFFDDHDELYWNVTGLGWAFPIERATATVYLPAAAPPSALGTDVYTGAYGSEATAARGEVMDGRTLRFATTAPLGPWEGLTIAASFPKGLVTEPDTAQRLRWFFEDNGAALALLLGVLVPLGWYLWAWNRYGRDPEPGVIIPRFRPPPGLSPAASRYVRRMGFDRTAFTAALVSLAVKGHVDLIEDGDDYAIERADGRPTTPPTEGEAAALDALLPGGERRIELDNDNHARFRAAQAALGRALKAEHKGRLFVLNAVYTVPAVVVTGLAAFAGILLPGGGPAVWAVFGVASLGLHALFLYLLRAPTIAGRAVMDEIEGFAMYLGTAERDRLDRMRSPTLTPEVFEAFLPYAYALGVENAWCERLARELPDMDPQDAGYRPAWYHGHHRGLGSIHHLGSQLGGQLGSAIASASTPPGSSSGSGGGGFSGGGGGGGGGGGW